MSQDEGAKAEALARLRQEAAAAHATQGSFVFGEGSPTARLMIVGEAPGEEEARAGRPFVGRSGKLLDRILAEASIPRDEVWISNVVKHRPTREAAGRLANRTPTSAEVKSDSEWLQSEIRLLRPRVILCLGNVAASALIHRDFRMTRERGLPFPGPCGSRVMATYHPAFVLRGAGPERERLIEEMREDVRKAKSLLEDS